MNAAIEWSRWDEGGRTSLPPDLTSWLPFGELHCGATNSRGLICTRLPGHTGRHAAGDGEFIVAVWGDPASRSYTPQFLANVFAAARERAADLANTEGATG